MTCESKISRLLPLLMKIAVSTSLLSPDITFDEVDGDVQIAYIDSFEAWTYARPHNLMPFLMVMKDKTHHPKTISVGYVVCNVSSNGPITNVLEILKRYPKVVAVIGIRLSLDASNLVSLATAIQLPVFTFANGINLDTVLRTQMESYVVPITSQSTIQVSQTIPDIVQYLGINIINIVHSRSHYGELAELLTNLGLAKDKIDIESSLLFDADDEESYARTAHEMLNNIYMNGYEAIRLKTFIALMNLKELKEFLAFLDDRAASNLLILTDSAGCVLNYSERQEFSGLRARNISIIYLCQSLYKQNVLIDFMKRYDYTESGILTNWYSEHNKKECPMDKNCPKFTEYLLQNGTYYSRYNHRIYYATLKVLKSLENGTLEDSEKTAERTCETLIQPSPIGKIVLGDFKKNRVKLPPNSTFMHFNSEGKLKSDFEVVYSSKMTRKFLYWMEGTKDRFINDIMNLKETITTETGMRMVCSVKCGPGKREYPHDRFNNCWKCLKCTGNTISDEKNVRICKNCNSKVDGFWANDNHTACDKPPTVLDVSKKPGKIIYVIVSVNIVVLITTITLYVAYWNNSVIKSSSRYLSSVIFLGLLSGHITSILLATYPSNAICVIIQVFSYCYISLTVAPIAVKTFRIWLVFKYTIKFRARMKKFITEKIALLQTSALILPQFLILTLSLFLSPHRYRFTTQYEEESLTPIIKVTKFCGPEDLRLIYVSIGYAGAQLLISTGFGWQCRKLPDNYKESMQIFLTSLICFMLVGFYVPAMVLLPGYTQIISLSLVLTLISLTVNVFLFSPKLYCVIFMPPLEQRERSKTIKSNSNDHSRSYPDKKLILKNKSFVENNADPVKAVSSNKSIKATNVSIGCRAQMNEVSVLTVSPNNRTDDC